MVQGQEGQKGFITYLALLPTSNLGRAKDCQG